MSKDKRNSFPVGVKDNLKSYVYRLIDPRNGETFYVGRGVDNRVFDHVRGNIDTEDPSSKIRRIRDIKASGFEVSHVIHRHGMDSKTAIEVESALIDAYPGLSNLVGGAGNTEFGTMHAEEIIRRYAAKPAEFKHKALLITINRSAAENSIYEATRFAWKLSKSKVRDAELVIAHIQGMIVGVFVPERWMEATSENFPGREDAPGRLGFEGKDAPEKTRKMYIGRSIPQDFRKRGAANPVKYTWGR